MSVFGDTTDEGDETFALNLSSLQAGGRESSISLVDGTGTITDDEIPILFVDELTQLEADSGTTNFDFTVTLRNPPGEVSVDVGTVSGTATSGSDFTSNIQTLNFLGTDGETQTFTVAVSGDQTVELDEQFTVALSNLMALDEMGMDYTGPFALVDGTGTVENDDSAIVSIADVAVTEGDAEQPNLDFTLSLSHGVDVPVRVLAQTVEETATAGDQYNGQSETLLYGENDFDSKSEVIEFQGLAGETATFSVPVHDTPFYESDETLGVQLTRFAAQGRAVTANGSGQGTNGTAA